MREPKKIVRVRCATYTRKSTEDGLEQDYNSLDAQHDACTAYILSQRHEGWMLLPERYDDGGFSGGTMERPGLKRLLADVASGKVDTIVIYKVDRLTRSLSDFAKIVEVLDAAKASFVSVTQSFNTTTSMGRLTLNMLLSFAQFEREVTGERIRDKIAASKRKGLWMGGPVPLGYDVHERKLAVNETEAELVRHICRRYLALPSVKVLIEELDRDGYRTKVQARASGPHRGGCLFRRGTLYHLLSNRIYRGMTVHKGEAYPGEHPAIVPQELWDDVQARLADRGPGLIVKRDTPHRSMLTGMLYDGLGRLMTANHASKGGKRYRYYVSRDASDDQPAWRVSAHDLERIVKDRVAALLADRNRIGRTVVRHAPATMERAVAAAAKAAQDPRLLSKLDSLGIERIDLAETRLRIGIAEQKLLGFLGVDTITDDGQPLILDAPVARIRRGHELRLVLTPDDAQTSAPVARDEKLVTLLAEAQQARMLVLANPGKPIQRIAADTRRCRKRLPRLVRLSWLAPDIMRAIMSGSSVPQFTTAKLLEMGLPLDWRAQRMLFGLA